MRGVARRAGGGIGGRGTAAHMSAGGPIVGRWRVMLMLILVEHHVLIDWLFAPPTVDGGPRTRLVSIPVSSNQVILRLCTLAVDQVPLPYAEMSLSQQMACNVDVMSAECRRACQSALWTACPAWLQHTLALARELVDKFYHLELDIHSCTT